MGAFLFKAIFPANVPLLIAITKKVDLSAEEKV